MGTNSYNSCNLGHPIQEDAVVCVNALGGGKTATKKALKDEKSKKSALAFKAVKNVVAHPSLQCVAFVSRTWVLFTLNLKSRQLKH